MCGGGPGSPPILHPGNFHCIKNNIIVITSIRKNHFHENVSDKSDISCFVFCGALGIPLGMLLSVETRPAPDYASRRDASLGSRIPTGCGRGEARGATDRAIPTGCRVVRFAKHFRDFRVFRG